MSPSRAAALEAYGEFLALYSPYGEREHPKACECLQRDQEALFTFYDFPAEHWRHLRTTNPIESTFATVRHRSRQTKGCGRSVRCGSRAATLAMVFKLAREAAKTWRKLSGYELIAKAIRGVRFEDGMEVREAA